MLAINRCVTYGIDFTNHKASGFDPNRCGKLTFVTKQRQLVPGLLAPASPGRHWVSASMSLSLYRQSGVLAELGAASVADSALVCQNTVWDAISWLQPVRVSAVLPMVSIAPSPIGARLASHGGATSSTAVALSSLARFDEAHERGGRMAMMPTLHYSVEARMHGLRESCGMGGASCHAIRRAHAAAIQGVGGMIDTRGSCEHRMLRLTCVCL